MAIAEELLRYIVSCVMYKLNYDSSYKITKEATKIEKALNKEALVWLKQFDKDDKVLVKNFSEIINKFYD